jgi:hypothetical protein
VAPYSVGERAEIRVSGPGGALVLVELCPERLVVVGELGDADPLTPRPPLPPGTDVRVIGEVVGAGDAYRSARRIHAGSGSLHLYVGAATATRRLLLAAIVELFAAFGLIACVVGMTGFFSYLALRVATR